jgi:mercuric ion transport protein
MSDRSATPRTSRRPVSGAAWLTLGGLAAAFGLASCCALPLLFGALGLGAAWLGGVAVVSETHRGLLMGIGAVGLFGGAVLLWRQQRAATTCGPGAACMPGWARALTLAGIVVGLALLWAGYAYV